MANTRSYTSDKGQPQPLLVVSIITIFSDKLKTELDKCVLLCSNCHKEEHYLPNKDI